MNGEALVLLTSLFLLLVLIRSLFSEASFFIVFFCFLEHRCGYFSVSPTLITFSVVCIGRGAILSDFIYVQVHCTDFFLLLSKSKIFISLLNTTV